MSEHYRRRLARAELDRVLTGCGLRPVDIESVTELTEGTFNTAYLIRLGDGRGRVLKVSPRPETPMLHYERGLMHAEIEFYRAAAPAPAPTPAVLHADFTRAVIDGDVLLMSECPGHSWHSRRAGLTAADRARLRGDLGRMVAGLHRVTGRGFGYPRSATPLARAWPDAVTDMFGALLADAQRFAVPLPVPAAELAALVEAQRGPLAEVDTPALVHFDLWNGNILLDFASGTPEIGGLIDGERAFWGDPVADLASLALFGDIEDDPAFLGGYRAAGGKLEFDDHTRLRLALYRCYLYLIMLVEGAPRGHSAAERAELDRLVGPCLQADLARLSGNPR